MLYTHITERERYVISCLHLCGYSYREIGRRLQRYHTSISQEIARNGAEHSRYWYSYTHEIAMARRKIPQHKKRQSNGPLMRFVTRRLIRKWSPEQISNRLKLDHPGDLKLR